MPDQPIIALWTVPRSVSTAFERMMMERGDVAVVHEPFSQHYYFGPEKRSSRFEAVEPTSTPSEILSSLEDSSRHRPVFIKDMAYHVRDLVDRDFVRRFTHTFLIRDPAWTIPSLARRWPDFTLEEAGFDALEELARAADSGATPPVIIDSDDLREDPDAMVRAFCDAVGIPFVAEALEWEPGMPHEWTTWHDWHRRAAGSHGFEPPSHRPPPALDDERSRRTYERCAPIYERLHRRRLRAGVRRGTHPGS